MPTSKSGFIVLDNLTTALSAVNRLIDTADEIDRPGLGKARREISDMIASAPDPQVQWAREILCTGGIDVNADKVEAVRELRSHAHGLGVLEAGILVNKAFQ
jgi:hypothetical protein